MEVGIKTYVLLNSKFTNFKNSLFTLLLLCWVQNVCAQHNSFTTKSKWRFQIETGLNYSHFLDKNTQLSGVYFELFKAPRFWGVKGTYNKTHSVIFNSMLYAKRINIRPQLGQDYIWHKIHTLGYGYTINQKKINVIVTAQLCYRTGLERYTHDYYYTHVLTSGIVYNKPWGVNIGVQAEYFITNNIGIGLNAGYYLFPFENTKLSGADVEQINPGLVARTSPNKEIFISSLKLFYNFALPKSINKLNPFKKK